MPPTPRPFRFAIFLNILLPRKVGPPGRAEDNGPSSPFRREILSLRRKTSSGLKNQSSLEPVVAR